MRLPFEDRTCEVLVRKKAETSPLYGRLGDPSVEELIGYGAVNIDKPEGPTSHQVSDYTKKILGIDRCGHSGTLDPKVTGVLPIALGRATRIVQTLLKAGKEYVAIMHIHAPVEETKIRKVMSGFVGRIKQLPPIKSAVKREERYRMVYYIDILEILGQDVLFRVGCEAGTYIRKLCSDIGAALGTNAHMAELRRTKAGPFTEDGLFTLQDLTDALHVWKEGNDRFIRKVIRPVENAVSHLPKVWVLDTTVESLCHGADLALPGISRLDSDIRKGDLLAVFTLKDELVCLGRSLMASKQMMAEKGLGVKTDKVFMLPGVYPKAVH
ncbi:MAG: RNA-guided pseudouridylation complex pseudouridine synthase subunit Cbf5 [archaeon]